MSTNSNLKIFVMMFIPIYLAAAYYVYNYHYNKINELKISRLNTINDISFVEDKMKKEYSKSPSIKKSYVQRDPSTRLSSDLKEIENELKDLGRQIESFKKRVENKFTEQLNKHIPNFDGKIRVKPEILIVDSEEKNEIVGNGPTNNKEINEEIELTTKMKAQVDAIITQLSTEVPYYTEKLEAAVKRFHEIDAAELKKRADIQWSLLERIANVEEQVKDLIGNIQSFSEETFKSNKTIETLTLSEFNDHYVQTALTLPLFELKTLFNQEYTNLIKLTDNLSKAQITADQDMAVNFINYKDYKLLAEHFGKDFKYKKLISTHDLLTKEKFAAALSLRSKVLIYMELYTGRRIGVYIDIAFPKSTKFPRSFKDPNSFIVYFNNKEFYKANPNTSTQFRTDNDFLLLIGNTRNNDGIWIKIPQTSLEYPVHFGKPTDEYDCLKGSLLTSPLVDTIYSFEVYELDLS